MITLAHLSDPHLGPLPQAAISQLMNKRLLGHFNWHRRRRHVHVREVADVMVRDVLAQNADHIAITGDLVNISLPDEFRTARAWLEAVGPGADVSVVPGNHDAYVPLPWDDALGLWQDYMTSNADGAAHLSHTGRFPYVRVFGGVALIGLSTAVPTLPLMASGALGTRQRDALSAVLGSLGTEGFYRIVLIHHPPLRRQNSRRKGLSDSGPLVEIFRSQGVELVLHGHNHRDMAATLETGTGIAHIVGVPSASAAHAGHRPAAQYNLYRIDRDESGWHCQVTIRGYDATTRSFATLLENRALSG